MPGREITRKRAVWILAAVIGLAALLRLWGVWDRPLWDDELTTLNYTKQSIGRMVELHPSRDSSPLGLYIFYHFYNRFGIGHVVSRLPMLLASILSVFLIYRLARTMASRRSSLFAAVLLAISPLATACSQEARMQSWTLMLSLAGSWALFRLLRNGSLLWVVLLGICAASMINLHYFSAFIFCAWALLILGFSIRLFRAAPEAESNSKPEAELLSWAESIRSGYATVLAILIALGLAAASFLPSFKVFFIQLLRGQSWRPPIGVAELVLKTGIYFAYGTVDDHFPTLIGPLDRFATGNILAGILILALIAAPFWFLSLYGMRCRMRGRSAMLVLAWIPPAAVLVITRVINLYDIRHMLCLLPPFLIFAAIGLDKLTDRNRLVAVGIGVWILGTSFLSLDDFYRNPAFTVQDFRQATGILNQRMRSGDVLVTYHPEKAYCLEHYLNGDIQPVFLIDEGMAHLSRESMEQRLEQKLGDIISGNDRVWLFDYHGKVYDFFDRTREILRGRTFQIESRRWSEGPKEFGLDLFTKDIGEAAAAYSDRIDLRPGGGRSGQVLGGLYPQSPEGRWMGSAARFVFANPNGRARACASYHLAEFMGDEPVGVSMYVDGVQIAHRIDRPPGDFQICGEPVITDEPLIYISLVADRTFIPAEVDARFAADTSEKSIFLFEVWLERVE